MKIFLNLLAAYSGGQITRAKEFTKRIESFDDVDLIVLKGQESLKDLEQQYGLELKNISDFSSPFRSFKRMFWENIFLKKNFIETQADLYLTFSHYLPKSISKRYLSIVGVSNLAPFSKEAWQYESFISKIRLFLLKKTIISSCKRATKVLALSNTCKRILIANGVSESKIFVASNGVDNN